MSLSRKGATRAADIPAAVLQSLSRGELQSANLTECMALDQAMLARMQFGGLSVGALRSIDAACRLGVLKRMAGIGAVLLDELGEAGIAQCRLHKADTVRGWACFMVGARPDMDLPTRLAAIRPLAEDAHFGVREWAWMAIRPHLTQVLGESISQLTRWAADPSERIRRFASEALRPRGVWCAHITVLKQEPWRALPVLSPLHADPSVYVQDSVSNWLNDAAKDQPAWVRELCAEWLQTEPAASTRRIAHRAMRNLK